MVSRQFAFLVGINHYRDKHYPSLKWCVNDVRALAQLLDSLGYSPICLYDQIEPNSPLFPTVDNIRAEFENLCEKLAEDDLLLTYFACHSDSFEGNDEICLIASDTRFSAQNGISVLELRDRVFNSQVGSSVFLWDMNLREAALGSAGTSIVPRNMTVAELSVVSAYENAVESNWGQHSVFAHCILMGLSKDNDAQQGSTTITFDDLAHDVRNYYQKWDTRLDPVLSYSLGSGSIVLVEQRLEESSVSEADGAPIAVASDALSTQRQQKRAQCFTDSKIQTELGIQLDLRLIPGGTFMMGSSEDELGRYEDESPQHEVTVPTFLMGRYPITQAQWRAVASREDLKVENDLEPDPSNFKGEEHPVEKVSWYEAVEFCQRLSRLTGHTYRLPTEAEWEYACRGGTTTPFHFGETITTDLANYRGKDDASDPEEYPGNYGDGPKGEYRETTTPVNQFHPLANSFGLCDMHGNVWEWCADHWHDDYAQDGGPPMDGSAWLTEDTDALRASRGGSWNFNPRHCRSACRNYNLPGDRDDNIGFRVVCAARGL